MSERKVKQARKEARARGEYTEKPAHPKEGIPVPQQWPNRAERRRLAKDKLKKD